MTETDSIRETVKNIVHSSTWLEDKLLETCARLEQAEKKLSAYYNIFGGRKMTDSIAQLQAKIEQQQAELEEWRNKEGSVCPEDVGFVEYIKALQAKIEQQQECIRELVRQGKAAYDYLCSSSKFDWDNLIKSPLKEAVAKAEELLKE